MTGTPRRQAGQASLELVGALLLVAAAGAVLLLAAPSFGARLGCGLQAAVAAVAGGGGCAAGAPEDGGPAPLAVAGDGPAIGDGRGVPALPFPGAATAAGGYEGGLLAASVTRSRCRLGADGREVVDLAVTYDASASARAGGTAGGVGGSAAAGVGMRSTYAVAADPATAARLAEGGEAPNPLDPGSIPVGTTITLGEESYASTAGAVAFRSLEAQFATRAGSQVSSAVQRVDADHVQVTVGDAQVMSDAFGVGVRAGDAGVSAGRSTDTSTGTAASYTLDVSTPEGAAAYAAFLTSGTLPAPGPGVGRPTTATTEGYTSAASAQASLGDSSVSLPTGRDFAGSITTTTDPATGQATVTASHQDAGVVTTTSATYATDADGRPTGEPTGPATHALHLQGVSAAALGAYAQASGADVGDGAGGNATLTLTDRALRELRQAALETAVREWQAAYPGAPTTPEDVAALEAHLAEQPDGGPGFPVDGPVADLVLAGDDPDAILDTLARQGGGSGDIALQALVELATAYADARGDDLADGQDVFDAGRLAVSTASC